MHPGYLALHSAALALPPRARRSAAISGTGGTLMIVGALLPWITHVGALSPTAGAESACRAAIVMTGFAMCLAAAVRWRGDVRWARYTQLAGGVLSLLVAAQLYVRAWRVANDEQVRVLVPHPAIGLPIVMLGAALVVLSVWVGRRR